MCSPDVYTRPGSVRKQTSWCASGHLAHSPGSTRPWVSGSRWASCSWWPRFHLEKSAARWPTKLVQRPRPHAPGRRRFAFVRWHGLSFFSRQHQPGQRPARGRGSDLQAVLGAHPLTQLGQRLLGRYGHLGQQRLPQPGQAQRHMVVLCPCAGLTESFMARTYPRHISLRF